MVRAVVVPRGWVVCAAKQGQQQHRELQRTLQRTWSPTERYSASRVVPVVRRHSEGVRCSGAEQFLVRGHRIAPFACGRPSLEKRERAPRRPSKVHRRHEPRDRGPTGCASYARNAKLRSHGRACTERGTTAVTLWLASKLCCGTGRRARQKRPVSSVSLLLKMRTCARARRTDRLPWDERESTGINLV